VAPSSVNPGLVPGVGQDSLLPWSTLLREPRACARGQLRHSARFPRDQVRVTLELIGDVPGHASKIPFVNRGHEVTPRPADSTGDPPIGAGCGHGFRETHEITQPDVGSEADDEVYVIRITQHSGEPARRWLGTRLLRHSVHRSQRPHRRTRLASRCARSRERTSDKRGDWTSQLTDPGRKPGDSGTRGAACN